MNISSNPKELNTSLVSSMTNSSVFTTLTTLSPVNISVTTGIQVSNESMTTSFYNSTYNETNFNETMPDPCALSENTDNKNEKDFYIGLSLALVSTIFIGSSFIFKKLGLLKLATNKGTRAGQGGYGYLKEWLWWTGMILMISGEFANFAAYAFAPATLVTPLGALSVIVSAVLSSRFLKEKLNLLGKVGCGLCVLGSTVMVIHSPKEQEVNSISCLLDKIKEPGFIIYSILMVSIALFGIFFLAPKYAHKNVLIYIMICSTLGSFTVAGCKGLGVALKETFNGENQFTQWLTWVLLAVVITCILVQLNYLNRALDSFNTAVVTPIYYVFFTSCVIIGSLVLFKEWKVISALDSIGNLCGFFTIICGIFLLQAFKDMNISWSNLPKAKKETPAQSNGETVSVSFDDPVDDRLGLLDGDHMRSPTELQDPTEYHDDVEFR